MTADEKEALLYQLAESVHGKGAAISYDPIPADSTGNRFRAIVWSSNGEALTSHFARTKDELRTKIVKALQAQTTARDRERKRMRGVPVDHVIVDDPLKVRT